MQSQPETHQLATLHDRANFQIDSLEAEIKVDRLCSALLKEFHQYLLQTEQLDPLEAGSMAAGADYFLREFMIGACRENIFSCTDKRIRQFAGNWYIVKNLEPNISELAALLAGAAHFFQYCAKHQLTSAENAAQILASSKDLDYFSQRIEDFQNISGDGYLSWNKACPL